MNTFERICIRIITVFAVGLMLILGAGVLPKLMYGEVFLSQLAFIFLYAFLASASVLIGILSTLPTSLTSREVKINTSNPRTRRPRRKEVKKDEPPKFPKDGDKFPPA